jgi:glycosyltransferase involved in cell wall biosynthesis
MTLARGTPAFESLPARATPDRGAWGTPPSGSAGPGAAGGGPPPLPVPTDDPAAAGGERLPSPIPTDDPAAALAFCRALARALDAGPGRAGGAAGPPSRRAPADGGQARPPEVAPPVVSVVLPVANEERNLPVLHRRLVETLEHAEPSFEIVYVDDGSRDGSAALLQALAAGDPRVTVIELARNFGHQVAISAGLEHARGRAVVVMDADLQDPPELLPVFLARWREGQDVVYGIRTRRKEAWLKRAAYAAFYRLLRRVASIDIPLDSGDFSIMDRKVVDLLTAMPERNRFVRGIRSWVGLNQVGVPYEREARHSGRPAYTYRRLLYLALDGLVSFSFVPLRAITVLGFGVSVLSVLLAAFYAVKRILVGLSPAGFATTVVAIFLLAGVQLMTIGVIGEYVGRIFEEVKQRPLYVVRRVVRGGAGAAPDAQ